MVKVVELKKGPPSRSNVMSPVFMEAQSDLSRRIVELGVLTEEYFLSLGTKVKEYSDRASKITKIATDTSRIMSGDDIKGAIKGLEGMVDHLEDIFNRVDSDSNKNLANLRSIGWSIRSVEKELIGLSETSRDLNMLALSTKIQSTKTGGGSAAFMQLGQDIARMSAVISSKAGDLFSETTILSDFVHEVQTILHDLKEKQKLQTESVFKGTRSIIESVADLSAKSTQEAHRIEEITVEISQSVSDMVTSVQYQDITRQSLDKVVRELNATLNCSCPEEIGEDTPSSPLSLVSQEIYITGQCLRQVDRLERTDDLRQEALEKMILSLEGIATNIQKMAAVTSAANRDSTNFLSNLESAMTSVTSFLEKFLQSSQEMSDSMNSLAYTVEGMTEFTGDIEMMSSEVELIALNAQIMAAQAGDDGAGMGVIAAAVQETASDSEDQRRSVLGKLEEIIRASLDLKGNLANTTQGKEVKPDQLGVFLDALRVMQERIVSMLYDIDQQSGELLSSINSSIDGIRDHIQLERRSDSIAKDMNNLAVNCSASIVHTDLILITGNRFSEEELQNMGPRDRMELVEEFFNEHNHEDNVEKTHNASSDLGDVVFFDNDK